MDEKLSWILGAIGLGVLGYSFWKWFMDRPAKATETTFVPTPPPVTEQNADIDYLKIEAQMTEVDALINATVLFFVETEGVEISPRTIKAVIDIESDWNPYAQGSADEIGLMQIKSSTAQWLGFDRSIAALYEPTSNIRYGTKYLVYWKKQGMDELQMVSCYNFGHLEYVGDRFKNQEYVNKYLSALGKYS